MKNSVSKTIKTLALALGASLVAATSANASIVYFSANVTASYALDTEFDFDMAGGVVQTSPFANANYRTYISGGIGPDGLVFNQFHQDKIMQTSPGSGEASFLNFGAVIGNGGDFGGSSYGDGFGSQPWDGQTTGYVGLFFDPTHGNTPSHYGWAQYTYNDAANTITLNGFAYNTVAGQQILAGQMAANAVATPEPGTLAMAGIGIVGIVVARMRRNKKAAAA